MALLSVPHTPPRSHQLTGSAIASRLVELPYAQQRPCAQQMVSLPAVCQSASALPSTASSRVPVTSPAALAASPALLQQVLPANPAVLGCSTVCCSSAVCSDPQVWLAAFTRECLAAGTTTNKEMFKGWALPKKRPTLGIAMVGDQVRACLPASHPVGSAPDGHLEWPLQQWSAASSCPPSCSELNAELSCTTPDHRTAAFKSSGRGILLCLVPPVDF